jgi:alpha-mannosidase
MTGKPTAKDAAASLVTLSGKGFDVPTVVVEGRDLLVRLFNAEGGENPCAVSVPVKPAGAELVELDGRRIRDLPVERVAGGRFQVAVVMPRFGLRTIRFRGAGRQT